jgi:hypothetical protein
MNYYGCFHHKFSELTSKFSNLLSGKKKWVWGSKVLKNVSILKKEFLKIFCYYHPVARTLNLV